MIIVGLDNEEIFVQIKNKFLDDVYEKNILFKEEMIRFISDSSDVEDIILTSDSINGDMSKEIYIKQLRLANPKARIILITERLDEAYRKFLHANEVFNILISSCTDIDKIVNEIGNSNKVVYKENQILNAKKVIPKQFIAVYGTSGSGKSYITSNIAKILSKDLKMKVGVVDMDLQNPAMDIYNNLSLSDSNLSLIVEDIDKGIDINDILDSRMPKVAETEATYITNNSSIYECQNKLNPYYYEKIYAALNNRYDTIIVDLPASPFIDAVEYTMSISSKVYFVVNPNYISIRQALKYLELMTKLWNVPKEKIVVIINKYQKNSLDKYQIESFFAGYKILDFVSFSANVEGYLNGVNFSIDYMLNKEALEEDLGIIELKSKNKSGIVNSIIKMAERRMS